MLEGFIGFCICAILVLIIYENKSKYITRTINKFSSTIRGKNKEMAQEAVEDICTNITKLNQESYISSLMDSLEKARSEAVRYKAMYIEYRDKSEALQAEIRELHKSMNEDQDSKDE